MKKPKRSHQAKIEDALIEAAVIAERKRCANLVPTSWLDSLLSGKDAPKLPLGGREVEALLRGIQDRIRVGHR